MEGKKIPKHTKTYVKTSSKKLKTLGIDVDVVGCQKNRKPKILKSSETADTYHTNSFIFELSEIKNMIYLKIKKYKEVK